MAFPPGTMIADYRLVKKLGEGGMGEVYLAMHKLLGNQVVLKCLHKQLLGNDEMRKRFVREAEAMALLSHPNILKIFNLLDIPEGVFIVMEFIEGEDFDGLLNRVGPLPVDRAIELTLPVLSALSFAHGKGVIHRDIKPANLMLLTNGEVRVLDFGIAKMESRPGLTRVGMTLGTATYMPPEQHLGMEMTPAADVYAIGVTLYELCTGRLPFESEDTTQFILQVMRDPPVAPRLYRPDLPERLDRCLLRCLEKKAEQRYPSAAALEEELRAILGELRQVPEEVAPEPIAQTPAPQAAVAPSLPFGGSGSTLAGIGAGAGAAGAAAGAWMIYSGEAQAGAVLVGGATSLWMATTALLSRSLAWYQAALLARAPQPAGGARGEVVPLEPAAAPWHGAGPALAAAPAGPAPAVPPAAAPAAAPATAPSSGQRTVAGAPIFAEPYRMTSSRRAIEPWRHASFEPGVVDDALRGLPQAALPRAHTVVAERAGPSAAASGASGPANASGAAAGSGKLTVPVERFGDKKTVIAERGS